MPQEQYAYKKSFRGKYPVAFDCAEEYAEGDSPIHLAMGRSKPSSYDLNLLTPARWQVADGVPKPPRERVIRLDGEHYRYRWVCSDCEWHFPFTDQNGNANSPTLMLREFAAHDCFRHRKANST